MKVDERYLHMEELLVIHDTSDVHTRPHLNNISSLASLCQNVYIIF